MLPQKWGAEDHVHVLESTGAAGVPSARERPVLRAVATSLCVLDPHSSGVSMRRCPVSGEVTCVRLPPAPTSRAGGLPGWPRAPPPRTPGRLPLTGFGYLDTSLPARRHPRFEAVTQGPGGGAGGWAVGDAVPEGAPLTWDPLTLLTGVAPCTYQ